MLRGKVKENLITGLIIVAPLLATLLIVKILFGWTRIFTDPVIKGTNLTNYTGNIELVAQIAALGMVFMVLILIGFLSKNRVGKRLIGRLGKLAHLIPVFRTLYFNIRQVTNAVTEQEHQFKKTVMVEYPQEDNYRIGFMTSEAPDEMQLGDEKLVNLYLPNSPNPTTGVFVSVPEEKAVDIDMSVKKALKLLMTSGMSTEKQDVPDHLIIEESER